MATTYFQTEKYSLTEFWGGETVGVCLQITPQQLPDHVRLTRTEVKVLIHQLQEFERRIEK